MDFPSNDNKTPQRLASPTFISLAQAALYWLKLEFISFGRPAGQIAAMHHDLVEKKRWISAFLACIELRHYPSRAQSSTTCHLYWLVPAPYMGLRHRPFIRPAFLFYPCNSGMNLPGVWAARPFASICCLRRQAHRSCCPGCVLHLSIEGVRLVDSELQGEE